MQYPFLPVLAFVSAFFVLVPLPWHWRARNTATLALIGWLFVTNLINGINALIWAGNVDDILRVWCDISSKLSVGAGFAVPLATVCICKHLEMVSSTRNVRTDLNDRRRRMIFELVMCFVIPAIFMALHYIVQGHRYNIVENLGCQPTTYVSIPALFIVYIPPLVCATITLVYASLALSHFIQRRVTFSAHLQQRSSALTTSRYLRLIAMSATIMIWSTAFTSVNIALNVAAGLRPWTTWADVHSDWNRADQWPEILLPPGYMGKLIFVWCVMPVTGLVFFAFFGWGEEARKEYRKVFGAIARVFRRAFRRGSRDDKEVLPSYKRSVPRPLRLSAFQTIDIKGSGSVTGDSVTLTAVSSPTKSKFGVPVDADIGIALSPTTYKVVREWEQEQEAMRTAHLPSYSHHSIHSTVYTVHDDDEIEISDAHSGPSVQYSDDFKPLPPLPSFPSPPPHGMSRPYSSSTLTSTSTLSAPGPLFPPALRHAASAPEMPVPLFHSTTLRHGVTVTVERQVDRV